MYGKFLYSKESNSIQLFGQRFWQRYVEKRLKFTLKGEVKVLNAYFVSTIGIKEKEMEIEVNWSQEDLRVESLIDDNLVDLSNLFDGCESLKSVYLDFSNLETKGLKKLNDMFNYCISLKELKILYFNPKNILDMSSMFCYCTSLKALPDISNWNTEFVTDMSHLFNNYNFF